MSASFHGTLARSEQHLRGGMKCGRVCGEHRGIFDAVEVSRSREKERIKGQKCNLFVAANRERLLKEH